MPAGRDPIREQLVEARRNQILDAAIQVFVEKGFHRATTKEIANTAGVSEGTIYNYFDSKEDLLIGIMGHLAEVETLPEEFMEALKGDVREFFVAVFRHRSERIQKGQEMLQAVLPEVLTTPDLRESFYQQYVLRLATILEQYVQARIDLGHIRPVNAALVTRAVQAMLFGLLTLSIMGDEVVNTQWDQLPETLATLIFDGLRPRERE
jgi:TetR/AcrR family fatty acid metabolism transcriptional regulator